MSTSTDMLPTLDSPQPEPETGWLRGRVREWESAQIITHDQASAILALEHDRRAPAEAEYRYQRLIGIVSAFGGILLGIGLILMVGSNWEEIPRVMKVVIAIVTVVALNGAGYWLKYRTSYVRIGETFLFVGAAAYGGAIFLVAQAYNYPVDDPNLLLLWFAPVLPMAYLVGSQMIAALGIAVGYGALGYRAADWLDRAPDGMEDFGWQTLYLAVGIAVASVGFLHERFERVRSMGRPYQWLGTATVLVLLYVVGFENWHGDSGSWLGAIPAGMASVLVLAAVVTVAAAAVLTLDATSTGNRNPVLGLAVPAATGSLVMVLLVFRPFASSIVPFALINLLLLAALVGTAAVGIVTRQEGLVNVTLALFGFAVLSRYLEIGGGMFGTGTSMMLGGVLLIALAWGLERLRRTLVARMRGES